MNTKMVLCGLLALTVAFETGCSSRRGGDQYNANALSAATYQGVIINVRKVEISENDRLQDNSTGAGLGALTGGLVGSAFGKGNGQVAGILGGALLGGVAGAATEQALSKQEGYEYTVKIASGNLLTIVQTEEKEPMVVNQRVFVAVGSGGKNRSRVYPDNSGTPMEVQPAGGPLMNKSSGSTIIIQN